MPTIDVQVAAGTNDGWVRGDGYADLTGANTAVGTGGGWNAHAFYRFTGITIPQGSTIDVCYISLYSTTGLQGTPLTKVHLEKANNPGAVTGYADFISRALTAGVDWDTIPDANQWVDSPSLVTPLQELIDAYDLSDQAIQVMHKNDGSSNEHYTWCRSYEYSGNTHGARLHIEYTEGGATAKTSAETGAGAESLVLQAAIARGEAAGGVDARQSLLAALVKNESGAGIEQSLLTSLVAKLSAETGSGIDIGGLVAVLAAMDSGLGVDSGWLAGLKSILSNDLGVGGDALKALIGTSGSGSDMKLPGRQGHVRIPSKGVSL